MNLSNDNVYPLSCICDKKQKVLLVDDLEFNLIPVKHFLEEHFKFEVKTALNGEEAL